MYSQDKDLLVVKTESIPGQVCCKREKKEKYDKNGESQPRQGKFIHFKKSLLFCL